MTSNRSVVVAKRVQWGLVLGLLALSPLAMWMSPCSDIYVHHVYLADCTGEASNAIRVALVVFGLMAAVIGSAAAVVTIVGERLQPGQVMVSGSALLVTWTIGWKSFPYWANGVFRANLGYAPLADFDPKALIPMRWIGEFWRMGVLALYPLGAIAALALLLGGIAELQRGRPKPLAVVAASLALSAACFLIAPHYLDWLMD